MFIFSKIKKSVLAVEPALLIKLFGQRKNIYGEN